MSIADEYLHNNAAYAERYSDPMSARPSRHVAVVACMDARLAISELLGLANGEAHVIRSLTVSQRLLGTTEIILIHHTACGMLNVTDASFKQSIKDDTGLRPPWAVEAFTDVEEDVRQSRARVLASPYIPYKDDIRGFVFDVATGKLNEVTG